MQTADFTRKICIIGTGGFGRETLCCMYDCMDRKGWNTRDAVCFMETDGRTAVKELMDVPVISMSGFSPEQYDVLVAIGNPETRRMVVDTLPPGTRFATVIHPSAIVSRWAEIGEGSIICAGAVITCQVRIGAHAQLNLHTTIGHDCIIGACFTTAPGARVSGLCRIGDGVYIGTNAAIKQGVSICGRTTIGMGGVVLKDITAPGIYAGVPVQKIR